ncbi:MAG TPA: DUF1302 family protein [Candidatus Binatia bacterium]|nr:DUF1302 family protein [Candidatus Binatia bacterium]
MPSARVDLRQRLLMALVAGVGLVAAGPAGALTVDDQGEIRFGMRAYTDVRIGTETEGGSTDPLSFPKSSAGHLRQHRYFLQLKLDHDLVRLSHEGWGLARLLGWLNLDDFKYSLQYRGEEEGLYDYGPKEFSDPRPALEAFRVDAPLGIGATLDPRYIGQRIRFLQRIGRHRERIFMAYLDAGKGPVFFRIGRQVLAWGETDIFRLLDNINPLDLSFGGIFIPLDEQRVPLDMVRGSYQFGSIGPLHEAFLEGFLAAGNTVATFPGIPPGSPWEPGGLGTPLQQVQRPVAMPSMDNWRGGARFVFNLSDVTFTLAHYYTYLDIPGVRARIPKGIPSFTNPIIFSQQYPHVPITGGSFTFPVPSFYSIVRGEAAWFQGQPFNRQGGGHAYDAGTGPGTPGYARLAAQNNTEGGLDPFVYPDFANFLGRKTAIQGTTLKRDTFNLALGLDHNRFIRWINPTQTIFFSTQFFYRHVFASPGDLVLPVPFRDVAIQDPNGMVPLLSKSCGPASHRRSCVIEPRLFRLADDQLLHTLLVNTSYYGGRVTPQLAVYYDWQGAILVQPGVQLTRDPFRLILDYTTINGAPTGQLGALRDRDNVRVQLEFVF